MKRPGRKLAPWGAPVILGIPLDHNSSFLRGSAAAPALIRETLRCDAWNKWAETGVDIGREGWVEDAGDLRDREAADAFARIEAAVAKIVEDKKRPVSLGGDHSVTYAILRAVGKRIPGITLLHFDAHPDLCANYEEDPHSHASPFARICEEKLAQRLIQIGVRTLNAHQREQAEKYEVEIFEMRNLPSLAKLKLAGPIYVSFDMDVLEPGLAPGVSHWEPGGLTTREALHSIQALPAPMVGADVVEFNPERDRSGLTATVAAKILKELLGKMLAA